MMTPLNFQLSIPTNIKRVFIENFMETKPILWQKTRDLHHACEQHQVGAAMATGTPPKVWYANWLHGLLQIHWTIDPHQARCLRRVDRLKQDLDELSIETNDLKSAQNYCNSIFMSDKRIAGASYVLTGAHLMGGEVMRRRLVGYPTKHLEWEDRKQALAELTLLREREDIVDEARACFHALLHIMDEIIERD